MGHGQRAKRGVLAVRRAQVSLLAGAGALAGLLYAQCGGWTLTRRSLLRLVHSGKVGARGMQARRSEHCRRARLRCKVLAPDGGACARQGGFQLAIKIRFHSEEDLERWTAAWRPLARHCHLREPHTLCYEM